MSRTENAVRNIVWGFIEKITTLLMPFACRTILIKTLGAEYLGLSSLFTSILSVLSISELGVGTAIVFSMYRPIADHDNATICALLNTYKRVYHIIGSVILFLGMLLLPFVKHLIKGSVPLDVNVYVLYIIYLLNTAISYFLFAYKTALFSAFQRNDLISKRNTIITFISYILQIALLILFKNYYTYALIFPLTTVSTNLFNAYFARKMFPEFKCYGKISIDLKNGIKKRLAGLISYKIYGVVLTSVDTVVISAFLGLKPLAIYNNYYYIQAALNGVLSILTTSITAGIGNKMVTCSIENNYFDFEKVTFMNAWLSGWCSICLLCLYQPFMQIWMGEDMLFPNTIMFVIVVYFLFSKTAVMTFTYREAAGLWWEDRFRPLLAALVNLCLNLLTVKCLGMLGVIGSTVICTVFINIPWGTHVLFKHYFKKSAGVYYLKLIQYIFVTFAAGILTYAICNILTTTGVADLLLKTTICLFVPNLFFLLFYHNHREFVDAKHFVLGIVGSIKKVL